MNKVDKGNEKREKEGERSISALVQLDYALDTDKMCKQSLTLMIQ